MNENDRFAEGLILGSNNGGGFGGGWEGLIGLILVGGLIGGWNGNGGGLFGGGNPGNGCCGVATQADLANGFAQNTIQRGIDDILLQNTNNLNFTNQGFAGLNTAIITNGYETRNAVTNGFAGVNNAICTLGYQNQAGFNEIGRQISDCCCKTNNNITNGFAELNYNLATNTCNIIRSNENQTQRILDFLVSEKLANKDAVINNLQNQLGRAELRTGIVSDLRNSNCPIPAYVRPDPNCCYNFGFNGCCGATIQ